MTRDDVELLLRSTRPVPAPFLQAPLARARGAGAPRLQVALAAGFLLAIVGVILAPPGGRRAPAERRWLPPVEISSGDEDLSMDVMGCQELVRTSSGAAALISDRKMWLSRDGKAPWKKIEIPGWHPSAPVVEGDTVSFLTLAAWQYLTVDVAKGEIVSQVRLPRPSMGKQWTPYLAASGTDRYAVVCGLGGPLMFLRSADGGRTWNEPREIARTGDNQMFYHNPAFLLSPGGLWLFYVSEGRWIDCRRSVDRGETWAAVEGPSIAAELGRPVILRATAIGDTVHLVCLTDQHRLLHFSAADGGRTWVPGSLDLRENEIGMGPRSRTILRSGAGRLLLSGIYGAPPRVSDDGGRTWKELDALDGIRGDVDLTPAFIGEDGAVSIAPRLSLNSRNYLLFREWAEVPRSAPLDERGRRSAETNIAHLSEDDIRSRELAASELVALGVPALPLLRLALAQTSDPERQARLRDVLRRIELRWPDAQVPEWWQGAR